MIPSKAENTINIELVSGIVSSIDRKTKASCINPTTSRSVFKTYCIEINIGRHVVEGNTQDKMVSKPIVCAKCRPKGLKVKTSFLLGGVFPTASEGPIGKNAKPTKITRRTGRHDTTSCSERREACDQGVRDGRLVVMQGESLEAEIRDPATQGG